MSQLKHGNELNAAVDRVIREANVTLVLISPYIRLHHRTVDELLRLKDKPEVEVTVCFGKSQGKYSGSFHPDAIELLQSLPNIQIVYDERLHAKFYGNEESALITSMNLYDYSQDNNIEVGVWCSVDEGRSSGKLFQDAHDYFSKVVNNAELVFDREPEFESKLLGLQKKYLGSKTTTNRLQEDVTSSKYTRKVKAVVNPTFESENSKSSKPENTFEPGFCIRTGERIPFDISQPLSKKAFQSWKRFGDENYPEKFCHFSGEQSDGQTSMAKPILKSNWKKSQAWIDEMN